MFKDNSNKMRRKFFIDGGSHDGCSVRQFIKDFKKYKIYSFEVNPKFFSYYNDLPTDLVKKAIWTEDCMMNFSVQKSIVAAGSSLVGKSNMGSIKIIQVEAIDFSKWIKDKFTKEDYIILKLDIEGAEYDVLEKMFEDETIYYIDKLFIEWHNHKLRKPNEERHNKLKERLEGTNIIMKEWDALHERIIQ